MKVKEDLKKASKRIAQKKEIAFGKFTRLLNSNFLKL